MRVHYRARRGHSGETVYERVGPVKWCCAEMCRLWDVLIGFGVRGCDRSTDRGVNLYASVPQAGGGAVLALTPVNCCPWCGEAVETCREK